MGGVDYRDPAGAPVFHYRSLLLPWQRTPDAAAALTGTNARNR